jgi:hypothetical protein
MIDGTPVIERTDLKTRDLFPAVAGEDGPLEPSETLQGRPLCAYSSVLALSILLAGLRRGCDNVESYLAMPKAQ